MLGNHLIINMLFNIFFYFFYGWATLPYSFTLNMQWLWFGQTQNAFPCNHHFCTVLIFLLTNCDCIHGYCKTDYKEENNDWCCPKESKRIVSSSHFSSIVNQLIWRKMCMFWNKKWLLRNSMKSQPNQSCAITFSGISYWKSV